MTIKFKMIIRSIVYGALIQALMFYIAWITQSQKIAAWVFWNVSLAMLFAGPMPTVGHAQDGGAVHEPTTIHLVLGIAGLVFGLLFYSASIYLALRAGHRYFPSHSKR